jgi:murein L,D-transpeptidase YcbB/YkuD
MRNWCTGLAPVHFFHKLGAAAIALTLLALPLSPADARRAPPPAAVQQPSNGLGIPEFYASHSGAPLWFAASSGNAAEALLLLLGSADADGLDPGRYGLNTLRQAVADARAGKPGAIRRADVMLSQAFVNYLNDLKRDPGNDIIYVDPELKLRPLQPRVALDQAAAAPSLEKYVADLGWMNPIYSELRQALVRHEYTDDQQRRLIELNLQRARALPSGKGRFIVVNAAEQRLYMWENRQPIDSMRVVVGKPKYPTPMMAALIRFASLNPYWYVPTDLAAERIAPNVVKRGLKYLDELGYQVLSDWVPDPQIIDPKTIDWKAVADGKVNVLIRQLPGPHNSMGRMKFMFPNSQGVYLHDNPERELFEQASRLYSGGCVRLEDAGRLGHWLFGYDLQWEGAGTEQPVPLNPPVPVYITYLTAMPTTDGSSIAYFDDVYGRDKARLATTDSATIASATASR